MFGSDCSGFKPEDLIEIRRASYQLRYFTPLNAGVKFAYMYIDKA